MTGVFAYTDIGGGLVAVGELHSSVRRGRVSSSFRYDTDFVRRRGAYAIEPRCRFRRDRGHWGGRFRGPSMTPPPIDGAGI